MQMFMFLFWHVAHWQSSRTLCNFFHVSIYKVVAVHSDFISIQAAVQLAVNWSLHNNIANCCVLGVCADVFVLLTFFIAYLNVLKF